MNRLRILGTALAAYGAFVLAIGVTSPAYADQPGQKTVTWTVTSGNLANRFGTPQTLYTGDVAACGVGPFQQDTYRYDTSEHRATVDALIAKGTLSGSSEDQSVWISNVDLPATEACPPVLPPETPAPTPSPSGSPSPSVSPEPIPTTSSPAASSTPTPVAPPASLAPTTPTATATTAARTDGSTAATAPEADQLAYTGARDAGLRIGIGAAFITAGLLLVAVARRKGKNA